MTPAERQLLQKLDDLVLTASDEDLRKIQELDLQSQLSGMSFCERIVNSSMINLHVGRSTKSSRKSDTST